MDKNILRKEIIEKRKILARNNELTQISKKICENIIKSREFIEAEHIALYYPLKYEVDLRELLKVKNKTFYLPRVKGDELEFAKYSTTLKEGCFKVLEPTGSAIDPYILDIIYVPALCCSEKCYRLGYGKGYYDRFFNKNKISAKKIIVIPECFVDNRFIEDKFDYKLDKFICESLK